MPLPTRALSIALLLLATACGPRADPPVIQGHWVAESFRVQGIGLPIGPDLYVSKDQLGLGGDKLPMKLKGIATDGSEVTLQTELGLDIVFAFEGKDRMYFTVPILGDRIYYQRSSAPQAQSEPPSELQYRQAVDAMRRGDADASLRSLSAALASGFTDWQRIDGEPLFAGMSGDVRFQVLRSRWKKS